MSTKSGQSGNRKRPQKHQNNTAWKVDKHKTDPKTKFLVNLTVTNCCAHCTGVIEWRIKYGKYKSLNQPAKCIKCGDKKVKFAYHVLCQDCVESTGNCAKCNKAEEIVNTPQPSEAEARKLEAELILEAKTLPERKRRTFLRYLRSQEKRAAENTSKEKTETKGEEGEPPLATPLTKLLTLTQIRLEAKKKLVELKEKCSLEDDFNDLDFGEDDLEDDSDFEDTED